MTEIEAKYRLWRWAMLENFATLAAIVAITLGVYAFGGGAKGLWSLVLLMNMNMMKRSDISDTASGKPHA